MESPPEDVVTPLEITFQSMDGSTSTTLAMGHEKTRSDAEPTGKPSEAIVECRILNVAGAADGLLAGCKECAEWGVQLREDGDGIWVILHELGGITFLAEAPSQPKY